MEQKKWTPSTIRQQKKIGEEADDEKAKKVPKARHAKVRTLLHFAVERGRISTITTLLQQGADIDESDHNGRTALLVAADKGDAEVLEALLEAGADVAAGDNQGLCAVHLAAAAGSVEALALLKARACDLRVGDGQGRSPLHVAAERGQVSAVQWLLKEGVPVGAADGRSRTPLDAARALGHEDVVAVLEEALQLPRQPQEDAKDAEDTAGDAEESLPSTDRKKDTEASEVLTLHGDEVEAADLCPLHQYVLAGDAEAAQELIDGGANIHEKGPAGRSAVHIAAEKGHLDVLKVLIEAGCEVTVGDSKGRQPIHLAALGGHAALLQVLHDNSASLQNYDRKGMRAIHFAAAGGSEVTLDLLLQLKCDLDLVDAENRTPLHLAVLQGQRGAVEWLLTKRATADKKDVRNQTPLDLARALGRREIEELLGRRGRRAPRLRMDGRPQTSPRTFRPAPPPTPSKEVLLLASEGDAEGVKRLAEEGADLEAMGVRADERGLRALHLAARAGDAAVARALVEGGADVHAEGPGGFRSIHYAASCGNVEILKLLQEARCDLKATTAEGLTALHLAAEKGHLRATEWLVACAGLDATRATQAGVSVLDLAQQSAKASVVAYVQDCLQTAAERDKRKEEEKGNKRKKEEKGNERKKEEKGNERKKEEKGNERKEEEKGNKRKEEEKGNKRKEEEKGNKRKEEEKGNEQNKEEKGNERNKEEKGNKRKEEEKGNKQNKEEKGNKQNKEEKGNERKEEEKGNKRKKEEKGNKQKKEEKGNKRKELGTPDLNSQILSMSSKGDVEGVKRLANAGVHLETASSLPAEKGFRAVHYASRGGHVELLKVLQELEVNLRALTDEGDTALHVASGYGNLAAVKWLVEQGGFNGDALLTGKGSALEVARDARDKGIVKYLVHFQLVSALLTGDVKTLEQMAKDGVNLDPAYIYNKGHGFRSVHYAAKGGHLSVLKMLQRKKCKLKATTPEGLTALHIAAENGHLAATKWLIGFAGLDVACVSRAGLTAADLAARAGSADVVAYLQDHDVLKALLDGDTQVVRGALQTGTDVDKLCMEKNIKGFQAVHYAAKGGQVPILEILKESNCNLKGVTNEGLSALHYAVRYDQLDAVKWLVEEGELDVSCTSKKGSSALDFARDKKKQEIAAYLESLIPTKEGIGRRGRGRSKRKKEKVKGVKTQETTSELNSEILLMARMGDAEGVKRLAEEGANIEVKNLRASDRGLRPLHLCALAGHAAALEALIGCGADVHAGGPQGLSVVHYASRGGHVEVLKVLQELGVDLWALTDAEETALHVAADYGNLAAVKWLVEQGGFESVSLSREEGSALDLARKSCEKAVVQYLMNVQLLNAVTSGDLSTVNELIEEGIKIDDENAVGKREGFRIVHHAADSGHKGILKLLKQAECNMEAATEEGPTALHVAARGGKAEAVRWLVERGRGGDGVSAEELARESGKAGAVRWLVEHGRGGDGVSAEELAREGGGRPVAGGARGFEGGWRGGDEVSAEELARESGGEEVVRYFEGMQRQKPLGIKLRRKCHQESTA